MIWARKARLCKMTSVRSGDYWASDQRKARESVLLPRVSRGQGEPAGDSLGASGPDGVSRQKSTGGWLCHWPVPISPKSSGLEA